MMSRLGVYPMWLVVSICLLIDANITPALVADTSSHIYKQDAQSDTRRAVKAKFVSAEFIVKFMPTVEEDMTAAVAANRVTKSSLSYLNNKYRVKKATPLFKKRLGKTAGLALSNIYLLEAEEGLDLLKAVEEYSRDPNVEYAEPNYIVHSAVVPNDQFFSLLWGLHNTSRDADIDAPEAWDIETGGSNAVIAVIDTGVDYTHEDLAANIWRNPNEISGNGIDDDGNGYIDDGIGWDFSTCERFNPYPPYIHRTYLLSENI